MSFRAYGVFVEVEPVVADSALIKLPADSQDDRSVFRVVSVGEQVKGIEIGGYVYTLRTSLFADRGTGVSVRVCHMNEIIAVAPAGEEIVAAPVLDLGTHVGGASLN